MNFGFIEKIIEENGRLFLSTNSLLYDKMNVEDYSGDIIPDCFEIILSEEIIFSKEEDNKKSENFIIIDKESWNKFLSKI